MRSHHDDTGGCLLQSRVLRHTRALCGLGSFLLVSLARGQAWTPIGPPAGSDVRSLLLLESNHTFLYAAVYGAGVFRTTDAGATWSPLNDGLTNLSTTALAGSQLPPSPGCPPPEECFPPDLYVGTTTGLFHFFLDSWSPVAGVPAVPINSIAKASGSVWAGTEGKGLYHSADFGQTWAQVSGLPGVTVQKVATTGGVTLAIVSGGMFRSTDGGATWNAVFPIAGPAFLFYAGFITFDPTDPTIAYTSGSISCAFCGVPPQPALMKSVDGGATWSALNGPSGSTFVDSAQEIYVGDFGQVQQSLDGGLTWQRLGVGLPSGARIVDLAAASWRYSLRQLVFAAVQGSGVYLFPGCGTGDPCLANGRLRIDVSYSIRPTDPYLPAAPWLLTANTAAFAFFSSDNIDLVVNVLDGYSINGHIWVFYGSLTNVAFRLTVTDTLTGAVRTYTNSFGQTASVADTEAF